LSRMRKAFENLVISVPVSSIRTQREVVYDQRRVLFYKQIAASIEEIGLIEPLVVCLQKPGEYLLLDGHMRLDVLKRKGVTEVACIVSTDDEAYTYNRRVNSIPSVAQHVMLLKALENGLTEERIAASLRVDISAIRRKRDMLDGICEEVVKLLQTRKVGARTFSLLKKMKPLRQIEAAEHMIANSVYSSSFVRALLYATKVELLVNRPKTRKKDNLPETAKTLFAQESETLLKDLKTLESALGREALTLTVFRGYVRRLVANPRVHRYLERKHREILGVLEGGTTEANPPRDELSLLSESA
jgi:ParB-like chromosome segregation protein Spo0J